MCIGLLLTLQVRGTEISITVSACKHSGHEVHPRQNASSHTHLHTAGARLYRTARVVLCITLHCKLTKRRALPRQSFFILSRREEIHQICSIWWGRICTNARHNCCRVLSALTEQLNLSNRWFTMLLKGTTTGSHSHFCYFRGLCNTKRYILHPVYLCVFLYFDGSYYQLWQEVLSSLICCCF